MTSNRTSDKASSINRLSLKECDSDVDDGGLVVVTVAGTRTAVAAARGAGSGGGDGVNTDSARPQGPCTSECATGQR